VRALRTTIVVLVVALGFLGGYFLGWYLHGENVTSLSSGQRSSAKQAGALQQRIIEELQGRYYKAVDVNKLSAAGVNGTLKSLNDPWTVYIDAQHLKAFEQWLSGGSYYGIGAALRKTPKGLTVTRVFSGTPAEKAGLKRGDTIVSVDGKPIANLSEAVSVPLIKGKAGTQVTLEILPGGRPPRKEITVTRQQIAMPETDSRLIMDKGVKVGYVYLSQFGDNAASEVTRDVQDLEAKGAQWFILDVRNDPGGFITQAVGVTNVFTQGVVTSTKGLHSPLDVYEAKKPIITSKPMVVLVNGQSASASEIVTGALKDHHRATIIGTRTFGKGLVQETVPLGDGSALKLTIAVYLTPNGTDINHKGIVPNIVVVDNPKTKLDEQLQAALNYIARRK
jgi:carboxyl-terminal processing protease